MAPLTWTLLYHRLRVLLLFFKIKTRSSHRLTIWEWHNVLRTESYHLLLSTAREMEDDWCCIPFPFLITTKVKSLSKGTDFPSDDLLLWSLSKRPFHRQRLYSSSSAFHKLLLLLRLLRHDAIRYGAICRRVWGSERECRRRYKLCIYFHWCYLQWKYQSTENVRWNLMGWTNVPG